MLCNLSCFKILRYSFNFSCFSAAFGMTIFWCYRFWKDEDLCLVDYLPHEEAVDIPDLMMSVCFRYPFIESRLRAYNTTIDKYEKFLQGTEHYTGFEDIDFQDVTLSPKLFYVGDSLQWKNGAYKEGNYPNHVNELPYVTFAGYYYWIPIKCYGFALPDKNVKFGYFALNATVLTPGMSNNLANDPNYCIKDILVVFHMANQMLLSSETLDTPCIQNMIGMERLVDFRITNLEIIRRRNKHKDPCIEDHKNYDVTIVNDIISTIGCRPPYIQSTRNWTICKTKEMLKSATVFELDSISDHLVQPCLSIGDIRYVTKAYNTNNEWNTSLPWLSLAPPKKIKLITQVRDVDMQTVIGNAGGYVGLFLGKYQCYCNQSL